MWKGVAARDGELGAPLLDGALGWLECRLADEVATGTHTFFVGAVVSAELGEDGVPLVRLGGELRAGS
jgi:flavin reductase (DIM6/NTAB) family NADH-FMN oxidoreductase RutF